MTALRKVSCCLAQAEKGRLYFECPGCDLAQGISHGAGGGPRSGWKGNLDALTFTPSVPVRYTLPDGPRVCHSFVSEGRIQFLEDCTHHLARKTVDLPDWEDE